MESSSIFVCSAINLTQKQDLCISGGHFECEKAGFLKIGLLISASPSVTVRSSDSDCGMAAGPCIWQLPPKCGPPSAKLIHKSSDYFPAPISYSELFIIDFRSRINLSRLFMFKWKLVYLGDKSLDGVRLWYLFGLESSFCTEVL